MDIVDENSEQVTEQRYMEGVNLIMERHKTSNKVKKLINTDIFDMLPDELKYEVDREIHKEMEWIEELFERHLINPRI